MNCFNIFNALRHTGAVLYTAATICCLVSCGDDDDKKNKPDTSYQSPVKSSKIIEEIHARQFALDWDHSKMAELSLAQIEEIRTYCNIERWNNGGDAESRGGTNYEAIAKVLNIPVSKLESADTYYGSAIMRPLDSIIKALYHNVPGIQLDHYRPLKATGWCGMHTILTELLVYNGADEKEIKELAAIQATDMIAGLPEWVDGIKFTRIIRKDTILQTTDELKAGFIWRRGEALKPMTDTRSGFGRKPAHQCTIWFNNEWNEEKKIQHPAYTFLKPVAAPDFSTD
ncbi:MAG: hypothetical protein EOO03_05505 [Chitinophagaceae bacterium]|nr:MAG: hypothetical protein EOO03_05505 [Chitinophagaceae bacterium]